MDTEQIIRDFLDNFWQDRCWQIEQTVLGATITPRHPGETLYQSGLAINLRDMARAAVGDMPRNEMTVSEVRDVCQQLAEYLFAAPGTSYTYHIPDEFSETPIGALWWRALLWCEGDELITIAEAARLAGVTEAAIGQSKRIRKFVDPTAPARQGRRLVRRTAWKPRHDKAPAAR
jgi:methylthioribose-1-phosphate isomerase